MKNMALSPFQQQTVLEYLHLVSQVIKTRIRKNETVYGLGYEELMQEGYLLLCRAAVSYDPQAGPFEPYAKKVIYNGLITHCRKVYQYESRFLPLKADELGNPLPLPEQYFETDSFAQRVELIEILDLLSFYAQQYRGTTKRGIEALSWKLRMLCRSHPLMLVPGSQRQNQLYGEIRNSNKPFFKRNEVNLCQR